MRNNNILYFTETGVIKSTSCILEKTKSRVEQQSAFEHIQETGTVRKSRTHPYLVWAFHAVRSALNEISYV